MKQKYLLLSIILSVFLILFFTTSLALIPGDFGGINNGPSDGVVDFEDLMIFAMAYGSNSSDSNWNPICDIAGPDGKFTPDGVIDFEDLMIFAMNYGEKETMVPDYTLGLSWAGVVEFNGETYLKGGETYDFVLAFDYVITDPELRYIVIRDYSNPATPGIIFNEFMTLADLTTTDNMVFFGEFTPPSICDSGGEYCTAAYVEAYGLGANCCAPCRYKFNADATLSKAEIKITVKDCCGWAFLEFDSMPITCDGYCCGDECTELAGWAIDIYDTIPVWDCCELKTDWKCHHENGVPVCPIDVNKPDACADCCLDAGDYWIITTLTDKVGNVNNYYVKLRLLGSTGAWTLTPMTQYLGWVCDPVLHGDDSNPWVDSTEFSLITDGKYGDTCSAPF